MFGGKYSTVHQNQAIYREPKHALVVAGKKLLAYGVTDIVCNYVCSGYTDMFQQVFEHVRLVVYMPGPASWVQGPAVVNEVRDDKPKMWSQLRGDFSPVAASSRKAVHHQHGGACANISIENLIAPPSQNITIPVPIIRFLF